MASKETANCNTTIVESIVNRWLVDYYVFLSLESFKNEQYKNFSGIRRVLDSVLARPLESTDAMPTKIRILQFLSRINEGDRLDMSFEPDQSITPLESALLLLGDINKECNVPQQDFENVCTSIKEMMVKILIKNNEFDKAKEVLNKHFPKPMVGKKAIFMALINKKSRMHEIIELIDFHQFKAEMLTFSQNLCSFSVPFLHKAAKQLIDKRLTEQAGLGEQDEPGQSSSPPIITVPFVPCERTIIQRTRLEEVYKALAAGDERTFAQLEEEVEREEQARKELSLCLSPSPTKDTNQDRLFQRDSGSPIEASPADQTPQTDAAQAGSLSKQSVVRNRRLYTVAQLVVEPDSQPSSQCSTASPDVETEVRTEESPQSPSGSQRKDPQSLITDSEITKPIRKLPRRINKRWSSASTSLAEMSTPSEEDAPGSLADMEICVGKHHSKSNNSLFRNSTKSKSLSSHGEEDPQESAASLVQKTYKPTCNPLSNDPGSPDDIRVTDLSLDSLPNLSTSHPIPQTSSTPEKDSGRDKDSPHSKWKQLYNNAKESKESWSDEESYFNAREKRAESRLSGQRKRKWTESETQKLRDGVKKFGEGNWGKIRAYYRFNDRTNVNLKDRWRTMKKLNMV